MAPHAVTSAPYQPGERKMNIPRLPPIRGRRPGILASLQLAKDGHTTDADAPNDDELPHENAGCCTPRQIRCQAPDPPPPARSSRHALRRPIASQPGAAASAPTFLDDAPATTPQEPKHHAQI
jgi:hypothetical protein